ncbi:MAG: restriction endonuclease subunit S [Solirubrobacterales bacterium]
MTALPPGWVESTLSEIADWGSGGTPRATEPSYYGGCTPWAVIGDLADGLVSRTESSLTERGLAESSAKLVEPGTVLVAMYGSIGKLGIAGMRMATNQAIAFARPRAGLDPKYLFLFLRRERSALSAAGKGATQRNISQTILRSWPIPIAPVEEQKRIVAAIEEQFSRLDDAEKLLERALRGIGVFRAYMLSTAFVGDWQWTTLGEIADIAGGVTKDAKRQSDPSFVAVPYLRVANVQRGFLDLAEVTTIRVAPEKARALELKPGDVLFNEGGDRDKLGRGWVWSGEIEGCIHQNHVFRARLREGFDPKFVSWHGNIFGRRWFEEHGRQTTNLASLNLKTLKSFPVPVPPLDEQLRIVSELEQRLSLIDALAVEVARAGSRSAVLRRSILGRAFTGRLVPQDPADEPASVLLERIAAARASEPKVSRRRRRVPA